MNVEALVVIGIATLLIGLVLYVPGYFLGRWLSRKAPQNAQGRMRITRAGFVAYGTLVLFLMVGLSMQHLAPESLLGRLAATGAGRGLIAVALIVLWAPVELICKKIGIPLVQKDMSAAQQGAPADATASRPRG